MTYLLAKFTLLFLLAAVLGFLLGYWWSRRRMVDVTESYEDLRKATERNDESQWQRLWSRLDALPEPRDPDLSPVVAGLDEVHGAVKRIPQPAPVNLAPVEARIDSLAGKIAAIPAAPAPEKLDLRPLHTELSSVREHIAQIPRVDLEPIGTRLHKVESELARLGKRLAAAPTPRQPKAAEPKPTVEGPRLLRSADYGKKDDLKRISGVGPKLERLLNQNGIYYFWQVASWSSKDVTIIDEKLDVFKGRISRDNWVDQARTLKQAPDAARMPEG